MCVGPGALLGVILSLTLLVEIHLAGIVLALAIGLLVLWCRPRVYCWPVVVGVVLAGLIALPYVLDHHLDAPKGNRLGYRHFWRVIPGAAMSVSSFGWHLEFNEGYTGFLRSMGPRRWAYLTASAVSVLLLGFGMVIELWKVWKRREEGLGIRREPRAMISVFMVLIVASFIILGLRTSPTYLPVWYPLPFAIMGLTATKLSFKPGGQLRGIVTLGLVVVLFLHLAFFTEQLYYMHVNRGVPQGLGQSYQGMEEERARLVDSISACEIWMVYEGPCGHQDEGIAYSLRHAKWKDLPSGRVLIRYRRGALGDGDICKIENIESDAFFPKDAFLIHPWIGPQQVGAIVPYRLP